MPATTTVTILTPSPRDGGTATITQGVAAGQLNRQVTITATPASGYKFERYDITYEDIQLTALNVGLYSDKLDGVCTSQQSPQQHTLYYDANDGFRVFSDPGGVTDAPVGYYKGTLDKYYTTFGGVLGGLYTCPIGIDDTGGGGRGNE